MDATKLRQIDKELGYDRRMNAMVFDMEKKRVAQPIRDMPKDNYAMIDAQMLTDVNDAPQRHATDAGRQARQCVHDDAPWR